MQLFKKLRKMQKLSLEKVSKDICSIPMLSRWENNNGHMDFYTTIKLFERINISAEEYISLAKIDPKDEIALQIEQSLKKRDENALKNTALKLLENFHNKNDLIDLDYASIACALYFRLTHKNIFPIADQNKLNQQLSKITIWSKEYLSLFSNIIPIVSPRIIFQVSSQVIENIDFCRNAGDETLHFACITLLEAVIGLFRLNSYSYARTLLLQLNQISLPDRETQVIIGRQFLNGLIDYHQSQDSSKVTRIIDFLFEIGLKQTGEHYSTIFKELQRQN